MYTISRKTVFCQGSLYPWFCARSWTSSWQPLGLFVRASSQSIEGPPSAATCALVVMSLWLVSAGETSSWQGHMDFKLTASVDRSSRPARCAIETSIDSAPPYMEKHTLTQTAL